MQKDLRIVIPAFNSTTTIIKCIDAIIAALSFHSSWEIVIVDNGENQDLKSMFINYPVSIVKRDEYQSAAYSRNEGVNGYLNGILVFIDSDVICENNCIKKLIQPIENKLCKATIGNYSKNINGLSFSQKYKQLYINHIYSRNDKGIKNDFWTAICSLDASVFHELNGFNTNFKGANGEDQEFGIRLTKKGYKVVSVKDANGQHLNPYGVINIIKNDFKKGITAVKNSLENKVPLSDNRHSKGKDMFAVFFSISNFFFVLLTLVNHKFIFVAFITFILWFISRCSLNMAYLSNGGYLFFIRSTLFMICLDWIRFMCVIVGFLRFKIFRNISSSQPQIKTSLT